MVATLLADVSEYKAKLGEANASMAETEAQSEKSMGGISSAAKTGALVVAGAIVAVGALALDLGAKYEASTAKLAANAQISIGAAQQIGSAFLGQAFQTTFSAQQTETAYAGVVGQLDTLNHAALNSAQALGFMKDAQDLAEASGGALDSTTAALAKTMQAFAIPVSQATSVSNDLFNASVATGNSIDTLSTQFAKIHTTLGAATPPIGDLSALLVDMAAHGETGRGAISALGTAMTGLAAPTKAQVDAQQALGVSFTDSAGKLIPMEQIIAQAKNSIYGMGDAQAITTLKSEGFGAASVKLLTTIRAGGGVFDSYVATVNKAGSAHAAAEKNASSLEGQEKRLQAGIQDLLTIVGTTLVNAFHSLITIGETVVMFFVNNKDAAMVLAGVLGVGLVAALVVLIPMVWAFTAALLANPITWVVAGVIALVAAFVLAYNHVQAFRDIVNDVVAFVGAAFGNLVGWIKGHWDTIAADATTAFTVVKNIVVTVVGVIVTIIGGIVTAISAVVSFLSGPLTVAWNVISTAISVVVGTIVTVIGGIITAVQAIVNFLSGPLSLAWNVVSTVIGTYITIIVAVIQTIITVISAVIDQIKGPLSVIFGTIGTVAGAIFGAIATVIGTVATAVGDVMHWIGDRLTPVVQAISGVASKVFGDIAGFISAVTTPIFAVINAISTTVAGGLGWVFKNVSDVAKTIFNSIVGFINTLIDPIKNAIKWVQDLATALGKISTPTSKGGAGIPWIPGSGLQPPGKNAGGGYIPPFAFGWVGSQDDELAYGGKTGLSIFNRSQLASAGAGGGGGASSGVTYAPTYNIPVTGDMSPQTALALRQMLDEHDQNFVTTLRAARVIA